MEKPSVKHLVESAGISKGYASDILNEKQDPSRPLAIHLLRTTGFRHKILADLTDEQIVMLEDIEPWSPRPERTGKAA